MRSTTTDAAARAAAILADELAEVTGTDEPPRRPAPSSPCADWARSGAMLLTGAASGPPRLAPGAPASWMRGAACFLDSALPDPAALLGERAACARRTRQAPRSVGGTFRSLPTADGWFGLNLARPSDVDLLPALVEGPVEGDPWQAVAQWVAGRSSADAEARARLLGLPGTRIPAARYPSRRPAVEVLGRGPRRHRDSTRVPIVVDLSSLWAGPLCAQLLGSAGARVIKVESWGRPDGARRGSRDFLDLLHGGHESVALHLDRPDGRRALAALLGSADVVVEASRPRALRHLGLYAEEYVERGAVWVAISAYGRGQDDRVGFGDDVAAGAGLVVDDGEGPYPVGDAIADPLTGLTAAAAASAALRSGRGWLLDISMHDIAGAVARLAPDEADVLRKGTDWYVAGAGRPRALARVCAPRARCAPVAAADFGAHTDSVLAELADTAGAAR